MTLKTVTKPKAPQEDELFVRRRSRRIPRSNALSILEVDWDTPPTRDCDDSQVIALATTHRVDIENKIAASIRYAHIQYSKQC